MQTKRLLSLAITCILFLTTIVGCGTSDTALTGDSSPADAVGTMAADGATETGKDDGENYVVGFANIAEEVELQIAIRESIKKAAADVGGITLIVTSNDYDSTKAVKNADDMVTKGVDAFIEFNVDESVAPVIMEKMDAAGIPVFAIDIPHPGAAFFGADNVQAGQLSGEFLANTAREKWGGEPDCLLLIEDSSSGELPLNRINEQIPGFRKIFPDFSDDKIFRVDGLSDAATAQKMVADFLSAHPDYTKITIGAMHDIASMGALAAIETAGKESNCIMVNQGETYYLEYLQNNPEFSNSEVIIGAVAYFYDRYGDFLLPDVKKVLDGGDMPENVYVQHQIVNRDNAKELFPSYFE